MSSCLSGPMSDVERNPAFALTFLTFFLTVAMGIVYLACYSASCQPLLSSRSPLEKGCYVPLEFLPVVHYSGLSRESGPSFSCYLVRP